MRDQIGQDAAARAQAQDDLNRAREELGSLRSETATLRDKTAEYRAMHDAASERVAELETQARDNDAAHAANGGKLRRWRWAAFGLTVVALGIYTNSAVEHAGLSERLGANETRLGYIRDTLSHVRDSLNAALSGAQALTRRATDAEQRVVQASSATPSGPKPVCPNAMDTDPKYWKGTNTFAVSPGFSRACVIESANQLQHGDLKNLFKAGQGAAGTTEFAIYVLSINGIRVNPITCDQRCLASGFQQTTHPASGDLVVFNNSTVGIFAGVDSRGNEMVYEFKPEFPQVVEDLLSRATVRMFVSAVSAHVH